ncbi:adenosine deaminase [Haematococcus lacustris]
MPALAPSMEEDCTPHVHRSHALAPEQLQRLADRLGVTVQTLPPGLTSDSANGLLHAFISVVPKAELHIHIEGSLEPSMMLELAERNGMPAPYPSVEAAQAAYNFADLQSFLDLYYNGCAVLKTTRDFYDLAWAYLRKAAANRVVHAEIFFDPQTHLANGAGFDVFMPGFLKACEDARRALGINSRLIMCFLRHLSLEDAEQTLDLAQPYLSHIIGVGLDSSELGNPPLKFEKVMARVRELGLPVVAHAGEEGPAQYVWDTIKVLKASRVDHGVHSLDDPELMAHLAATQLPLTVCPLSNLKLKVYDGQLVQRLQELVLGPHALCITINSDDPAYFGGYMNQNYSWLAEELDLGISAVAQLARNGFLGSFISEDDKELYVKEVDFLEKAFLDL